jgi:hypothetical protein
MTRIPPPINEVLIEELNPADNEAIQKILSEVKASWRRT